jgi:hypothetical protein
MTGRLLAICIGVLFAAGGCKPSAEKDSMGGMKMDGAAPTTSPSTMPAATGYTCSMHPEVVSDTPGKCPKCGMTLVAKK